MGFFHYKSSVLLYLKCEIIKKCFNSVISADFNYLKKNISLFFKNKIKTF